MRKANGEHMTEPEKRQNAKHTPGPWTQNTESSLRMGSQLVCLSYKYTEYENGKRNRFPAIPRETIDANTRLIAAAPDLLAALKGVLVAIDEDHGVAETQETIRAAIAKAEGRA